MLPYAVAVGASSARFRPVLERYSRWIPISIGVGLLAGSAEVGTCGTSRSFFYSGNGADGCLNRGGFSGDFLLSTVFGVSRFPIANAFEVR